MLSVQQMSLIPQLCSCLDTRASPPQSLQEAITGSAEVDVESPQHPPG